MFIRKKSISKLIRKERSKERAMCEKASLKKLQNQKNELTAHYESIIKGMRVELEKNKKQSKKEIKKLNNEIQKNRNRYNKIRLRENSIDDLTKEVEIAVSNMVMKVQESVQPFYRMRAKVEATKRVSDKKHPQVETLFRAIK